MTFYEYRIIRCMAQSISDKPTYTVKLSYGHYER